MIFESICRGSVASFDGPDSMKCITCPTVIPRPASIISSSFSSLGVVTGVGSLVVVPGIVFAASSVISLAASVCSDVLPSYKYDALQ